MLEQILKEELLVMKINQSVLKEHNKLVSERKDAQSLILREILYSKYGRDFDIYQIDESLWGKVKNMVAKGGKKLANAFNVGKRGYEKELDRQELEDLTTNAGKALPGGLIKQLTQPDPNGESFPNQEDKEDFASRLDAISFAYGAIKAGLDANTFPHESAEAAITALKKFLENSLGKMSTVYKTFNEEEEGDEEEVLNEINLRRVRRIAQSSKDPEVIQKAIDRMTDFISKRPEAGIDGNRAGAAGDYIDGLKGLLDRLQDIDPTRVAEIIPKIPDPIKDVIPNLPDPETIRTGVATTTGASGPAVKIINTMKSVPSLKGFLATLGVSPAAAAAAAGVALVGGLYIKGKISSRAASIKRLLKTMVVPPADAENNIVQDPGEPAPSLAGPSGDAGDAAAGGGDAAAGGGDAAAGGGEAAAGGGEEKGGRDIYVFKGKGGKGIQSQLAKLGVKGKTMSGFLRALKKDLTAAGFNVLEEANRETISLQNTLAMLDQMKGTDATTSNQKKAIKKILIQLLRSNKIRVDPESSKKLMDTEAPAGSGKASDPKKFFEYGKKHAKMFANNLEGPNGFYEAIKEPSSGLVGFDEGGEIVLNQPGAPGERGIMPKIAYSSKATPEQIEYFKQFVAGIVDGLKTLNESKVFARWKLIAGVNKRVL